MISETEIRRLNDKGLGEFRAYLATLRSGAREQPPYRLLEDAGSTETFENGALIQNRKFQRRLEVAQYLDEVLPDLELDAIDSDIHLWSWLSLFFFEQVCPLGKNGMRKPGRDYRHILEPGYRHGHNHLLCGAYMVYSIYGLGDRVSSLLLYTPLNVESKFHHQLAQRQNLITNRGLMAAAYLLYFNQTTNRPKRGALARRTSPGTLFRFIDIVQQFDLTYDLYSMSGPEILKLLPPEFDKWKQ